VDQLEDTHLQLIGKLPAIEILIAMRGGHALSHRKRRTCLEVHKPTHIVRTRTQNPNHRKVGELPNVPTSNREP
jgi:hypothetical protein